jgi:serine/threonine-protein kinase
MTQQARAPFLQPGELLEGKYRVERTLGEGGMGAVVAAHHVQLDEPVAIKVLLPHLRRSTALVQRFQREARALAKIKSEHVARVSDVGESAEHGPYIVMELLRGEDLGERVKRCGPLGVEEAVTYVLQACAALAEAHGRGIVHRDLKPANLFLTHRPDGTPLVKILDFGISKVAQAGGGELTATAMVLGSFAYMSPEQARNAKDVDGRSDLWSLGIILQKLCTGRAPFEAETPSEFVAKIIADPPVPPRAVRPDLPAELEAIILRCLEKDRARRFATVGELALALAPFAPSASAVVESILRMSPPLSPPRAPAPSWSGAGPAVAAAGAASTPAAAEPAPKAVSTVSAWTPATAAAQRRAPVVAIASAVGLAGLLALAGVVLIARRPAAESAESPPAAPSPPPEVAPREAAAAEPVKQPPTAARASAAADVASVEPDLPAGSASALPPRAAPSAPVPTAAGAAGRPPAPPRPPAKKPKADPFSGWGE